MIDKIIGTVFYDGLNHMVIDPYCGLIFINQKDAKQFKNRDTISYELKTRWFNNKKGKTIGWEKFAYQPKLIIK
jgi:hypothetical protein